MARTFDEDKRTELINTVGKYYLFCEGKPSCRKCAEYLTKAGNSISNATVKDYLDRFMRMNPETAPIIYDIVSGNKPKTIEDESVRNRVIMVSNMVANGLTIEDVFEQTGYTKDVIHNDITKRIYQIDIDLALKVKEVLTRHKLDNLMHGNDEYLNQERNADGTFRK